MTGWAASASSCDDDGDAVARWWRCAAGCRWRCGSPAALRVHHDPLPTAELADWLARQGLAGFAFGELSLARTIGAGFDRLDPTARRLFEDLGLLRLRSFAMWTAAALLGRRWTPTRRGRWPSWPRPA